MFLTLFYLLVSLSSDSFREIGKLDKRDTQGRKVKQHAYSCCNLKIKTSLFGKAYPLGALQSTVLRDYVKKYCWCSSGKKSRKVDFKSSQTFLSHLPSNCLLKQISL